MAKIKLLTPDVYNKIAAGEVVEKPYGAVKELVENSIDAGATRIVIEVKNGGFDLISVTDNGCGISEEDVELAFVKHATSKLSSALQLAAIETLGFRGEALSSIAAVSRVTITTRTRISDVAVKAEIEEGEILSKEHVAANVGTKIEVRDLFYNTPARRKFFHSSASESAEITKFVAKLILTNPMLEIIFFNDGKIVYENKGNGLNEAIYNIYGADCLKNLIEVNYVREDLRITGYISNPEYTKANKNYQTLSVNNRYVTDTSVVGAILQAYKPYLMTKRFPVYVLDLFIPCDLVDVNVHPKKSEVRFAEARKVCGAFHYCVTEALKKFSDKKALEDFSGIYQPQTEERPVKKYTPEEFYAKYQQLTDEGKIEPMNRDQAVTVHQVEESTDEEDKKQSLRELGAYLEKEVTVQKALVELGLTDSSSVAQTQITVETPTQPPLIPQVSQEDLLYNKVKILGAAFKTYLILELDDKLIFVDQHAAHERILFDKFMANRTQDMQSVLFPYTFNVTEEEGRFIEENRDNILSAGIEISPFGPNSYKIDAVSTLLCDLQMGEFVQYLLSSVDELRLDDRTLIVEKLAKKACKAAVKANYTLSEYEIKYILKQVYENKITQCPHGRPVTVIYTKTQLEKQFKRIM